MDLVLLTIYSSVIMVMDTFIHTQFKLDSIKSEIAKKRTLNEGDEDDYY
jgi:hypothetical protein